MKPFYKVVITTSGIGSRLGDVTCFINKALVRVGKKAAISYILENIPAGVPVVVTLGYKKEQVQEYLRFAHPERHFEFVEVDLFKGEGSSLGYSLLSASKNLQCPFIYVACDTLFSLPLEAPKANWMAVARSASSEQYTSVQIGYKGNIQQIYSKGAFDYDAVYVGLSGIFDHETFWQELANLYHQDPLDQSLNDTKVFSEMIRKGFHIEPKKMENWLDIGNQEALQNARKQVPDYFDNLEKLDESIYLFDPEFVLKFFHDPTIVQKRLERARCLGNLVPKIQKEGRNFYRYEYAMGELFSRVVTPEKLKSLLLYCQSNLWCPVLLNNEEKRAFRGHCENFYYKKTHSRTEQFYQLTHLLDKDYIINNQLVPSLGKLLEEIDWNCIFDGHPSGFHGDLHFENILLNETRFCFLDWRQDFDGLIRYGDTYYDLAKLNHGMIVSHEIVRKNLFEIRIEQNRVFCEILRSDNLVLCQEEFFRFLNVEGFDAKKVEILTALIFLNIAPLHHHPYNLFLHFFGRLRLWYALRRPALDYRHPRELLEKLTNIQEPKDPKLSPLSKLLDKEQRKTIVDC